MIRGVAIVLCLAQVAYGQQYIVSDGSGAAGYQVGALPENVLYANLQPLDQFATGYGNLEGGKVERIDQPEQQLAQINEVQAGQDQVFDKVFPDEQRQNRVDNTKEIHSYTTQQKVITVNNRNLYRYLKNLFVNTQYNTNIQKINHAKLQNLLITNLQETHQPKLLIKYSRQDTVQDLGQRSEQPIVENARKDNVLPPIIEPAVAEKIGYNGLPLGMASSSSFSSGSQYFQRR